MTNLKLYNRNERADANVWKNAFVSCMCMHAYVIRMPSVSVHCYKQQFKPEK